MSTLEECTAYNTGPFSLQGTVHKAKVSGVYDGDTLTGIVELFPTKFYQMRFRLQGIDTPEICGPDKVGAIAARNRVIELITGQQMKSNSTQKDIKSIINRDSHFVFVRCGPFEKYGRVLAEVFSEDAYDEGESINAILLREGLAVQYMTT